MRIASDLGAGFGLIATLSAAPAVFGQNFVVYPSMPPLVGEPPVATFPSRYMGCNETVAVALRYRVDYALPTGIQFSPLPYRVTGWGADAIVQPPGSLSVQLQAPADGFVTVPRTRDGDGLAAIAWPSPVEAIEVETGLPGPGNGVVPAEAKLGVLTLSTSTVTTGQDIRVSVLSTPGDSTEGIMIPPTNNVYTAGRFTPYYQIAVPPYTLAATHSARMLIRTVPFRRCPADIAGANQAPGPDQLYTADDIIVFLGRYFDNHPLADVAGPNQSTIPDGVLTADDTIVFLAWYFQGCSQQLPCGSAGRAAAPGSGARAANRSAPALEMYDAATVIAMQQLIDTLPAGAQRDALQSQLNARTPGATPAPAPSPAPDDR